MAAKPKPAAKKKFDFQNIMDKINNMPKNVQQALIGGVLALGGGGYAYYTYLLVPNLAKIELKTIELAEVKKELETARNTARQYAKFKREEAQVEQDLRLIKERLPDKSNVPEFMQSINAMLQESGLYFGNLRTPGGSKQMVNYSQMPMVITTTGDYHQTAEFLVNVSRLRRLVGISQVSIKRNPNKGTPGSVSADVYLNAYQFSKGSGKKKKKKKRGR